MADGSTSTADPQAGTTADPQGGTGGQPQAGATDGDAAALSAITDPAALAKELAKVSAELTRARGEAAAARIEARTLREGQQATDDAEQSETKKLERRQKELERELEKARGTARAATIRAEIMAASVKLGVVDPDAAAKLLDHETLELDEATGLPTNVEPALRKLIAERPWLGNAKSATPPPGSTNGASGSDESRGPNLTADELATAKRYGLTPEAYAAMKDGGGTLGSWQAATKAGTASR